MFKDSEVFKACLQDIENYEKNIAHNETINMFESFIEEVKEYIKYSNESNNKLLLDITALNLLKTGYEKINTLSYNHEIYKNFNEKKERFLKLKKIRVDVDLNNFNSSNKNEIDYLQTSSTSKEINDYNNFFAYHLTWLNDQYTYLKENEEILDKEIGILLEKVRLFRTDEKKKGAPKKELGNIIVQFDDIKRASKDFENCSTAFTELYTFVEKFIIRNNELENKIEQGLAELINDKKWDNKAIKFSFWRPHTPNTILTMRAILADSALSHETKIIKIINSIKQVQQPRFLRNKLVQQFYQQLDDLFKEHYPNLYAIDSTQQETLSATIVYDEKNTTEINQSINAIMHDLKLNDSKQLANPESGKNKTMP